MAKKAKKAVALAYQKGMKAPEIIASGKGHVAENMLEEAKKHEIPVYKDDKLATILTELEIGEQIPEALYDAVAQVLVFVSDLDELYQRMQGETK